MDSSNSGSFQSSSGGVAVTGAADNEEYDSRTQSISSFLNPTSNFNQLTHLLQPPPPSHHHQLQSPSPPPTDTTATYFNPNPFQDPGSLWTGQVQPNNNRSNLTNNFNYSINPNNTNTHTNIIGHGSDHNHNNNNRNHQMGVAVKNPKKRTRASRRAPTTVLTTDTTNFRQMVQEFTGIPAAPFTTGGPFSRRLDLFRSSPQKLQPQSILPYSSNNSNNNITTTATSSSNYNLPPSNIHDQFQKPPSSLMDLQNNNPMLSFQSLLQTTLPPQQQSNDLVSGFSKRWRGQDEKIESFEGVIGNNQNIGAAKLNSGLEHVVSSSDQVQGNDQGSWICPSS